MLLRLDPKKFPLLPRKKNTSKADYGHALILAGSTQMPGAAILAAEACLRSGAGLVTLAAPKSAHPLMAKRMSPEIIFLPLPEDKSGSVGVGAWPILRKVIQKRPTHVIAVGPGLTRNVGVLSLVRKVVGSAQVPIVLDADGINAFQFKSKDLQAHSSPMVMTPHQKEFERVFSVQCPKDTRQRLALAKKLAHLYDVTIVLKGHRTLVASEGQQYQNNTGNPGMAKGGTGDVLTGMIAAFIAQGLTPFKAACWAVYFHGKAGDLAVKVKGELGLLASDTIDFLPEAFSN